MANFVVVKEDKLKEVVSKLPGGLDAINDFLKYNSMDAELLWNEGCNYQGSLDVNADPDFENHTAFLIHKLGQ